MPESNPAANNSVSSTTSKSSGNAARTFHVAGVPEHFNLPWHLALESNAFEEAGVEVQYTDFPGGTGAMTRALAAGEIDIAILLSEGAIADILNGGNNRIVKVYVQSPLIWGIHVAANSPFHKIDDIAGQKYAISRFGSGSHLMAIVDADERGWQTDDMQFVTVGGLEGARKSLPAGESDAFLWEFFTTQPFVDSGEFRRIGERRVPWPAFVVSVNQDRLSDDRDAIKRLLQVVDRFSNQLMKDSNAVELISKRYDLEKDDAQKWFELTQWQNGFELPEKEFERVIQSLAKLELTNNHDATMEQICVKLA